jgi:hypothetical protein
MHTLTPCKAVGVEMVVGASFDNTSFLSPILGFQVDAAKFFIFLLIVMLINICAVSLAFFISAGVKNGELANLLIILPLIFSLVSSLASIITDL